MPAPGDPSFDRAARAARAKEAAANASDERLAELRARHLEPSSAKVTRAPRPPGAAPARSASPARERRPIDAAAIARMARAALDKHPATWTSYAELCSATGLTRNLAPTVARELHPEPTGAHWFRIRDDNGAFVAAEAAEAADGDEEPGDADRPSPADADRQLAASGVAVADGRADPARKLHWTGSGWALPGGD